jgi:hypothetical protein
VDPNGVGFRSFLAVTKFVWREIILVFDGVANHRCPDFASPILPD